MAQAFLKVFVDIFAIWNGDLPRECKYNMADLGGEVSNRSMLLSEPRSKPLKSFVYRSPDLRKEQTNTSSHNKYNLLIYIANISTNIFKNACAI